MGTRRIHLAALGVIVVLYVGMASAYALKTPKWNNPDEPAHFNYVRHIATTGTLPVLQAGDWDQAYLDRLKSQNFPDSLPVDSIRYESHQPPLYYLASAPVYWLSGGGTGDRAVLALRGFSIALGVLLLLLVFALAREALPRAPLVAVGAAGVTAGIPMHLAMTAAVNNDTLAEVILTASLLLLVRGLRRGFRTRLSVALGVTLGLALLAKVTIYATLALAGVALVGRWAIDNRRKNVPGRYTPPAAAQVTAKARVVTAPYWFQATLVYGIATVLSAWWFARNLMTYGLTDPFGLSRHDAVVVGQPRAEYTPAALEYFLGTTFQSFWGQFGWMGIVLDRRVYIAAGVLSAIAVVGLLVRAVRLAANRRGVDAEEGWSLGIVGLSFLLALGALLYYNLTFIQAQGRYLFPAIAAISLYGTVGVTSAFPRVLAPLVVAGTYVGLLALEYVCLVRFIAPYFGTL